MKENQAVLKTKLNITALYRKWMIQNEWILLLFLTSATLHTHQVVVTHAKKSGSVFVLGMKFSIQ